MHHQVAGVPGVTEALYLARQSSLAEEKNRLNETPMLYSCSLCSKGYRSSKAHAQHLKSRSHILRASQSTSQQDEGTTVIKPLTRRTANKPPPKRASVNEESEESEDEWEEVGPDDDLVSEASESISQMNVNGHAANDNMDESDDDDDEDDDDFEMEFDPTCCFMCDQEQNTIESCIVHMHKQHGFFIPDVEYLKDPKGLLTYLGLKVMSYELVLLFFPSNFQNFHTNVFSFFLIFCLLYIFSGDKGFYVSVLQRQMSAFQQLGSS